MVTWKEAKEWIIDHSEQLTLAIGGIGVVLSLAGIRFGLPFDLAWLAIIFNGLPIVWGAAEAMYKEFDVKADLLVSLALIAAVIIGEYFAAAEIAFIMQLGAMLEDFTVSKAQAGIERLVKLTPTTARVVRNDTEHSIPADMVTVGDMIRVLPGEIIPVDGTIRMGTTSVNQSVMTGESMPVDKHVGDDVFSGTINQFGAFDMMATKAGEDSSIQRMIKLVKETDPRQCQNCKPCRSLGYLDCGDGPSYSCWYISCNRRNDSRCDDSCCVLSLCIGTCHTSCYYGGDF